MALRLYNDNALLRLRDAIIRQAADDYRTALRQGKQGAGHRHELDKFWDADCYGLLVDSDMTGAQIRDAIRADMAISKRLRRVYMRRSV